MGLVALLCHLPAPLPALGDSRHGVTVLSQHHSQKRSVEMCMEMCPHEVQGWGCAVALALPHSVCP